MSLQTEMWVEELLCGDPVPVNPDEEQAYGLSALQLKVLRDLPGGWLRYPELESEVRYKYERTHTAILADQIVAYREYTVPELGNARATEVVLHGGQVLLVNLDIASFETLRCTVLGLEMHPNEVFETQPQ